MVKINKYIKQILDTIKPVASTVILLASMLSLIFDPLKIFNHIDYMKFDRTIGMTTYYGVNSEIRIQLYQFFNLLFIPVCLLAAMLFCYFFVRNIKDKLETPDIRSALSFLDSSAVCTLILVLVFIVNKYTCSGITGMINSYIILVIPFMIAVCTLFYLRFPLISFEVYRFGMFVSFALSLFVNFMFQTNTDSSLYRFYIIYIVISVLTQVILTKTQLTDLNRLAFASVPLSYAMLFAGLSLEACNILNQHNIFIVNRLRAAKLVFIAFFVLSLLFFLLSDIAFLKKLKAFSHWETVSIVGLVLSLSYFNAVPPLSVNAGTELFETANHGLLVNDLLVWGKFPMINSFDAHTLKNSFGGILYGFLNSDPLGAAYLQYSFVLNIITAAFTFLVFKNLFDKYFAFFLAVIAPISSIFPADTGFSFGVICIAAMLYAIRKKTFGSYFMLFVSVLLALVYNIPTGFSYGGAAVIVTLIAVVYELYTEKSSLKQSSLFSFIKAFAVFAAVMITAFIVICLQQKLDPIKRAFEFLGIAMSTNTWSRPSIGDETTIEFGLAYSFIPFVAVICICWLITHFKNTKLWYSTLAVFIAYVLNITRTLQRHTLIEKRFTHVIGLSVLGIALLLATYFCRNKKAVFAASGMLLMLGLFDLSDVQTAFSPAAKSLSVYTSPVNYYNGDTKKTTRVDLTEPLTAYSNVLSMINSVIPEGETYLDMTGQTMLYALSGREKPVYANQSVTELSGEYSQKRLIEEVEEEYDGICDFVLVDFDGKRMNIDNVSCFARYYYVLEYLYDTYRPLCRADNFALWIRKDRYDEFQLNAAEEEEIYSIPLQSQETESKVHSLRIENKDPLKVICEGNDPYITIPLDMPAALDFAGCAGYNIEMTYRSDTAGSMQVFYNFEGFNEADSSKTDVLASNDYVSVLIPITRHGIAAELKEIRIDPPRDSVFEVTSLKIVSAVSREEMITLDVPIYHANTTDKNWTNGVFNKDPKRMVFAREDAQILADAKTLYSVQGSAEVTEIITNDKWIQIITDKDASFFADGVTAVLKSVNNIIPIDYDYLSSDHKIELAQLPYVWGQFDTEKAWENPLVISFDDPEGELSSEIRQNSRYAMMTITSPSEGRAYLSLRNSSEQNVTEFCFDLNEGTNRYIIRCSADWWWNSDIIKSYNVYSDVDAVIENVSFLEDDPR